MTASPIFTPARRVFLSAVAEELHQDAEVIGEEEAAEFKPALDNFLKIAQAKVDKQYASSQPHMQPKLHIDPKGKKYVRIVKEIDKGNAGRSVFCFVDKTTGDVLKAASWKAPAKGVRGNIYNPDPGKGITAYGAVYNR